MGMLSALFGKAVDRRFAQIDQGDVVAIEGFEVVGVHAQALGA